MANSALPAPLAPPDNPPDAKGRPFHRVYGTLDFWSEAFDDWRERTKAIGEVERIVRSSREYRNYIRFLRNEVRQSECALMSNITSEDAGIELHHHPLTLFEVVDVIMGHVEYAGGQASKIGVAEIVCRLHYENRIGLVPLSRTAHEMAHAGMVRIPLQCVFGDYLSFVQEYAAGLRDEHLEHLGRLAKADGDGRLDDANRKVLEVRRTEWGLESNAGIGRLLAPDEGAGGEGP